MASETATHPSESDRHIFDTKATPRQVELIPEHGMSRRAQTALYVATVLVFVLAAAAVVMMWHSMQALRSEVARQSDEIKVELEKFKLEVIEKREAEHKATLDAMNKERARREEEYQKATSAAINKAIAKDREEYQKVNSEEIVEAARKAASEEVAKAFPNNRNGVRNRDGGRATETASSGRKPVGKAWQEQARANSRRSRDRRRADGHGR
ncbi:MAG TPA: hypothetical protein VGB76_16575 [Pyrinomonadaceae bacterium]